LTQSLHHLISTKAVPGVYNPPWAQGDPSQMPSAFSIPLETHLRVNTIRYLRTAGYHRPPGGTLAAGTSAAATTLGNTTGVLVPAYADPNSKLSVQASDPYDAPLLASRTRRRISELERLDSKPFSGGGRTRVLEPPPPTSVHATVAYTEPWMLARTARDLENSAAMRGKRVSTVPFVPVGPAGGRLFEDGERHRALVTQTVIGALQQQQAQGAQLGGALTGVLGGGVGEGSPGRGSTVAGRRSEAGGALTPQRHGFGVSGAGGGGRERASSGMTAGSAPASPRGGAALSGLGAAAGARPGASAVPTAGRRASGHVGATAGWSAGSGRGEGRGEAPPAAAAAAVFSAGGGSREGFIGPSAAAAGGRLGDGGNVDPRLRGGAAGAARLSAPASPSAGRGAAAAEAAEASTLRPQRRSQPALATSAGAPAAIDARHRPPLPPASAGAAAATAAAGSGGAGPSSRAARDPSSAVAALEEEEGEGDLLASFSGGGGFAGGGGYAGAGTAARSGRGGPAAAAAAPAGGGAQRMPPSARGGGASATTAAPGPRVLAEAEEYGTGEEVDTGGAVAHLPLPSASGGAGGVGSLRPRSAMAEAGRLMLAPGLR
jgi:hypothetical protein